MLPYVRGVSRGTGRFIISFPSPIGLGLGGAGTGGTAFRLLAVRVPAVGPVGRSQQAVGHCPHLAGRQAGQRVLTGTAEEVEGSEGSLRRRPHAGSVGADGDHKRGRREAVEGDAGVVAAVRDPALPDAVFAIRATERVNGAGGAVNDVDSGAEGGAVHAGIVPDSPPRSRW